MKNFKLLRKLLMSDGSIVVNKYLANALGLETAIMYSELLSKAEYFENNLDNGDMFYNTIDDMKKDTTLSAYQQRLAIKKLEELNLIKCVIKGLPATRYFSINEDDELLIKLLTKNKKLNISYLKSNISQQGVKKVACNNTNINNTNINNTNINNNGKLKLTEDIKIIFEYWKNTLNHQKAVFSDDRINKIKARLNEGFTVDDCKKAIDSVSRSSYHMGDNDNRKRYDSIGLIFRNADKLEWFINNNGNSKKSQDDILKEWNNEKE